VAAPPADDVIITSKVGLGREMGCWADSWAAGSAFLFFPFFLFCFPNLQNFLNFSNTTPK
jgi:hypothetical protein